MSARPFSHLHRIAAGRVEVHSPEGRTNGYIQRVAVRGQARPGYQPQDERGLPLGSYEDYQDRAWEIVNER